MATALGERTVKGRPRHHGFNLQMVENYVIPTLQYKNDQARTQGQGRTDETGRHQEVLQVRLDHYQTSIRGYSQLGRATSPGQKTRQTNFTTGDGIGDALNP
jgi:hypothetical protein